jgi:hypothetical protein
MSSWVNIGKEELKNWAERVCILLLKKFSPEEIISYCEAYARDPADLFKMAK